jgi:hypothetical protein
MSLSDTYENRILDSMIGSTQLTGSNTLWIGLSTTDPLDTAAGLGEPVGNGYARLAVVNSTNMWGAAAAGIKANVSVFSMAAATGSWGNVGWFAIWTAATSTGVGALLGSGALGLAKNVTNGDNPQFGVGSLSVSLD